MTPPNFIDATEYAERQTLAPSGGTDNDVRQLSDDELLRCVAEADRRGLAIDRRKVEAGYEALLRGQSGVAARYLGTTLFPNGADHIAAVVGAQVHAAIAEVEQKKSRVS